MQSRRSFLARAVASAGLIGVGTTAGCVGSPSGSGDGVDVPAYADRLYDPGEVVDASNRAFVSHDLATLYERRDLYPEEVTGAIDEADAATAAVSIPDLERVTGVGYWRDEEGPSPTPSDPEAGGSVLLQGSFQPDTLVEELRAETDEGTSIERAGDVEGHDLYEVGGGSEASSVALAVSERSVVGGGAARVDATGEDAVRAVLAGDDAGYYRESDTAARLIDVLGAATSVFGVEIEADRYAPDSFESVPGGQALEALVTGLRGFGSGTTLGAETVSRSAVGVYAEGETPTRSDVRTLLDLARQGVATRAGPDVDVERVQALVDDVAVDIDEDDRTATATVARETEALLDDGATDSGSLSGGPELALLLAPGVALFGTVLLGVGRSRPPAGGGDDTRTPPPRVDFDFEYDDAGEVTVTHAGGDAVEAENTDRLFVRSGDRPPFPWELPVRAGDAVTVEAARGDAVFVVWTAPDGGESVALGTFEVPA